MKRQLKVLLLFNSPYFKPRGYEYKEEFADPDNMYTENDVYQALLANGHGVRVLGLTDDIRVLLEEIKEFPVDCIFNLVDMFDEKTHWDKNAAALIEMLGFAFTGCSPAGLMICNNKALSKKILSFHRIKTPHFHVFERTRKAWLPERFNLPAVVKPLCEEASRGISQASIADNEESFVERIRFIHKSMEMDAIAEEYIEGREIYVTVIGHKRLEVLPFREMKFGELLEGEPRIATYKAKWDDHYRGKWGIKSVFAGKLIEGVQEKVEDVCKRAYRALGLNSYARFDIRVSPQGQVYILEVNANPCLARIDEMAQSAEKIGISYNALIQRIVEMALVQG